MCFLLLRACPRPKNVFGTARVRVSTPRAACWITHHRSFTQYPDFWKSVHTSWRNQNFSKGNPPKVLSRVVFLITTIIYYVGLHSKCNTFCQFLINLVFFRGLPLLKIGFLHDLWTNFQKSGCWVKLRWRVIQQAPRGDHTRAHRAS